MQRLDHFVNLYQNNGPKNDEFYQLFTQKTNELSFLKDHRDYIEKYKLGFGDRAFHYMWYLLMTSLQQRGESIRALEIGVYKGQVISLWSLIAAKAGMPAAIAAITPLEGTEPVSSLLNNRVVKKLKRMFSASFREQEKVGNLYPDEDYHKIISNLFRHFGLDFNKVQLHKGYSSNPEILSALKGQLFNLIYIDGDHGYEGAKNDIRNFSAKMIPGGYMVMDDASWYLEGTTFWKGHEEVSRAADIIEDLGFKNILNIGHNRVYQKI
jgi:Methyltransferase domain